MIRGRFDAVFSTVHAAPLLMAGALAACSSSSANPDAPRLGTSEEAVTASTAHDALDVIRQVEDHRLLADTRLRASLASPDPAVAEAAAIAVGRIGDTSLQSPVIALLDARDPRVRAAAAFALSLLPGDASESALDARLAKEPDASVRRAIVIALAQVATAASLPIVIVLIAPHEPIELQTAAAEALGTMVRGGVAPTGAASVVPQLLASASTFPETRATASAYALADLVAARVPVAEAPLTSAFRSSPSADARAFLAPAVAKLGTPTAAQALAASASSDAEPRVRAASCAALGTLGASVAVLDALSAALHDRSSEVVVAAATALGALGADAASLLPALGAVFDASSSAWIRATSLTSLVAIDPASARPRVTRALADAWPVQLAALSALAALGTAADLSTLVTFVGDRDKRLASAAIEAITGVNPALVTPALEETMRAALARHDWEITASVADVAIAFHWTDFAHDLDAAYDSFPGEEAMNARLEIVYALGAIGSAADLPVLQRGLADDEVLVSQYAAMSYQQLTGTDVSSQVRQENVVHTATPSRADIDAALASLVVLETTRGTVVLRMLPEAPLNATNFVRLASRGFYDGLPFHRVVPNFVVQGGDPRGDGTGGARHLVRDELSAVPHARGTVGLATEGKDTGSSQFFFNEGWNVHLDARYTVFAEVVYGIEAAERLEVGDTVRSATVF